MYKGEKVEGGYIMLEKTDVFSAELCDKIRKRLKVTEKELTNNQIRKTTNLSNRLIGEWLINNSEGFKLKNNGVLAVSKYMPRCFDGNIEGTKEDIQNNPKILDYVKNMFIKRLDSAKKVRKNFTNNTTLLNRHSYFYIYKVMWFNKANCDFKKAQVYEFEASRVIDLALNKAIVKGRTFMEWTFSDFVGGQFSSKKRKRKNQHLINAYHHD